MKSKIVAYLLWLFLGWLSAHRFYLNEYPSGVFYLFTLQIFGIGWLCDLFLIAKMVEKHNLRYQAMLERKQLEEEEAFITNLGILRKVGPFKK